MSEAPYQRIDASGAKTMIDDHSAVVVDVRTEAEFEAGHVPDSYNIPIGFGTPPALVPNDDFVQAVARLFPRDVKLVFI